MKKFLLAFLLSGCLTAPAHAPLCTNPPHEFELELTDAPAWYAPRLIDTAARLSARVPLAAPVLIEVVEQPGLWGSAMWLPEQGIYWIRLDPEIVQEAFLDAVLLHEWAHCMVWPVLVRRPCDDPHTELWGAAFSLAYRAFHQGPATPEELEWMLARTVLPPVPAGR